MVRNKEKRGETERNWKKQEEEKKEKRNKNVHVPMMQHNTTKIFKLIYTIHSFFSSYYDKNIFIKILQ